jgi:hypothetical protein
MDIHYPVDTIDIHYPMDTMDIHYPCSNSRIALRLCSSTVSALAPARQL